MRLQSLLTAGCAAGHEDGTGRLRSASVRLALCCTRWEAPASKATEGLSQTLMHC